jgi:hypothetical protein
MVMANHDQELRQTVTYHCSRCGQIATKAIGTTDFCDLCHHNFLQPLRDKHNPGTFYGRGQPVGPYDQHNTRLQCDQCNAEWTGTPGDPCNYCALQHAYAIQWQAEIILTPPDIDPDYNNRHTTQNKWGKRLRRAVEADIITLQQARNAWAKATTNGSAKPV